MNPDCLFCKIVAGKIPSRKIYEDEDTLAFHDINPAAPIHFLIIPKVHVATLAECEYGEHPEHQALLGKILALTPKLARETGCGYVPESSSEAGSSNGGDTGPGEGGFRAFISTGPGGGQEVYHLHMHVLGGPRPWKPR